uniref:Hemerythrin-like domain-containing protein n=1 Tax=Sinocyclocheilus anshuiensis TaxID=1608454 RepID=A0A671PTF9_9TELE
ICSGLLFCHISLLCFVCFHPQLSNTNFSNNRDFRSFLQSLLATFEEFKMHEQIENECIMELLQERSQTVYHVHADNKLSEMLSLFQKGLRSVKVCV